MENTFKTGEIVYDRIRPKQRLIIKHIDSNLYYCEAEDNRQIKKLVYLERDLMQNGTAAK